MAFLEQKTYDIMISGHDCLTYSKIIVGDRVPLSIPKLYHAQYVTDNIEMF